MLKLLFLNLLLLFVSLKTIDQPILAYVPDRRRRPSQSAVMLARLKAEGERDPAAAASNAAAVRRLQRYLADHPE